MRAQLLPYPKIKVRRMSKGAIVLILLQVMAFWVALAVNSIAYCVCRVIDAKAAKAHANRAKADKAAKSARIDALLAGRRERESKRQSAELSAAMREVNRVASQALTAR